MKSLVVLEYENRRQYPVTILEVPVERESVCQMCDTPPLQMSLKATTMTITTPLPMRKRGTPILVLE